MVRREKRALSCAAVAMLALGAAGAEGKEARCFTTDDGECACDFQPFGGDGSFTISAPGKPTFTLTMDSPGTAFGSVVFEPKAAQCRCPGSTGGTTPIRRAG